jgi:uncharacterized protein CbrC (UPF0167 family)
MRFEERQVLLNQRVSVEYFHGRLEEVRGICRDRTYKCDGCGRETLCFVDSPTVWIPEEDVWRQVTIHSCCNCIASAGGCFWHETEIGSVDELGRFMQDCIPAEPPDGYSVESLRALSRTPHYVSCQQDTWMVHCNDFMDFLGWWQPDDFRQHATDGNGRKLYLEMTAIGYGYRAPGLPLTGEEIESSKRNIALVWSVDAPDRGEWGGMLYYAFRCRHCGKLRGYYDCD